MRLKKRNKLISFFAVMMSIFLVNYGYADTILVETASETIDLKPEYSVDQISSMITELGRVIDHTQFDVEAKKEELKGDIARIFQFVRDQIVYESYLGMLRGAKGTLISMAGNSLDQALLLQALMDENKIKTRIVRGELNTEKSGELVKAMFQKVKPNSNIQSEQEKTKAFLSGLPIKEDEFAKYKEGLEREGNKAHYRLEVRINDSMDFIESVLKKSGYSLENFNKLSERDLLKDTRDHFWLQYKNEDQWIDLDASFPLAKIGESFAERTSIFGDRDSLPEDLIHEVEIRVNIEHGIISDNNSVSELNSKIVLTQRFESAEYSDDYITLAFLPKDLDINEFTKSQDPSTLIAAYNIFYPTFYFKDNKKTGESFDTKGELCHRETEGQGPAGGFGSALGALGMLDDVFEEEAPKDKEPSKEEKILTRVWLDFVVDGPEGKKQFVRDIIDVIGVENRRSGSGYSLTKEQRERKVQFRLMEERRIRVGNGSINEMFMMDKMHDALLKISKCCKDIENSEDKETAVAKAFSELQFYPFELSGYEMSVDATMKLSVRAEEGGPVKSYCYQPTIFCWFTHPVEGRGKEIKQVRGYDIINNEARSVKIGNKEPALVKTDIHGGFYRGVCETEVEAAMLSEKDNFNAAEVFRIIKSNGIECAVISGGNIKDIGGLAISEEARTRISRSVSNGYIVIAPKKDVSILGKETVGWWRINPNTGNVLGIMESGYGQALNEYSTIWTTSTKTVFWLSRGIDIYNLLNGNIGMTGIGLGYDIASLGIGYLMLKGLSPLTGWCFAIISMTLFAIVRLVIAIDAGPSFSQG